MRLGENGINHRIPLAAQTDIAVCHVGKQDIPSSFDTNGIVRAVKEGIVGDTVFVSGYPKSNSLAVGRLALIVLCGVGIVIPKGTGIVDQAMINRGAGDLLP